MSIDEQFVEFVVKSLVTKPDAVKIERRIDEKGVLLELTVDPEDLGRVIGKRGATAQSIRTLLRALGTKNDARYNLKIIDNGVGSGGGGYPADDSAADDSSGDNTSTDSANGETDDTITNDNAIADDAWSVGSSSSDDDDVVDDRNDNTDQESDVVAKTRRELRDLDDLDV